MRGLRKRALKLSIEALVWQKILTCSFSSPLNSWHLTLRLRYRMVSVCTCLQRFFVQNLSPFYTRDFWNNFPSDISKMFLGRRLAPLTITVSFSSLNTAVSFSYTLSSFSFFCSAAGSSIWEASCSCELQGQMSQSMALGPVVSEEMGSGLRGSLTALKTSGTSTVHSGTTKCSRWERNQSNQSLELGCASPQGSKESSLYMKYASVIFNQYFITYPERPLQLQISKPHLTQQLPMGKRICLILLKQFTADGCL